MAPGAPIKFTLYGPDDEELQTYSRSIITTRFLERAIDLSEAMEKEGQTKEVLTALDQLLVDFYAERFTLDQVKDGGDMGEKITVLYAIINRAADIFGSMPASARPNPTQPGPKRPRRRKSGSST